MKHCFVRGLSLVLTTVLLLGAVTFCWLSVGGASKVDFPTSFGSAKANYFEDGDGSPDNPYLISTQVHLYNLAWLQYLGYFNKNSALTNGRAQSYFRLTTDLVMTGVAIPPIGTEEYPFIGHFDGDGHVVSSLTVSNSFDDLKIRPTAAVFDKESAGGKLQTAGSTADAMTEVSIVGLFGVTGDYGSAIEEGKNKSYATGVSIYQYTADSTDTKKTLSPLPSDLTKVSENDLYYASMYVGNFYTDILHIRSASKSTLVGLAAGYVKGTLENVGVYRADMTVPAQTSANAVVSKYAIVGDFDADAVGWSENPATGGKAPGWGGSIDFKNFSRRLNYMMTATYQADQVSGKRAYYWNAAKYHFNFRVDLYPNTSDAVKGQQFAWDQLHSEATYATCDLKDDTYLPLNINETIMFGASYEGEDNSQITDTTSGWNINLW